MKLLDILSTASANMLRSKLRTFLTIIAIFIGALTLTLTNGIGSGVSRYIDKQVGNLGAEDVLLVRASSDNGPGSSAPKKYDPAKTISTTGAFFLPVLTEKDLDKIKKQSGILSVEPMLNVSPDYISGKNDQKYQLSISPFIAGTRLDLAAGKGLDNSSAESQVLLPLSYVSVLGFINNDEAVGKTVTLAVSDLSGKQSTVTGVVVGVAQQSLLAQNGVSINQTLLKSLYDLQTVGTPLQAKQKYQVALARFDTSISESKLNDLKSALKKQGYNATTIKDQIGIFKQVISAITVVLDIFGLIALLAASFGIINTLLMSVQERTKEIGLMKALGMSGSRIFLLFSTEAILLGFWGSLFGVIAASIVGRIANHFASQSFLKDLPGFTLLAFPWQSTLVIMGLIMFIAFLAGALPARRAASQNPIEALRYE